jgi:hypothetical protein
LLSSCAAVLLEEDELAQQGSPTQDAGATRDAAPRVDTAMAPAAATLPSVLVRIEPRDCGRCFELLAQGSGGRPPYAFEWEDGSLREQRVVCVEDAGVELRVVAQDAIGSRSLPQIIQLDGPVAADCPQPLQPAEPPAPAKVCLENLSLEGVAAANFGQDQAFDAAPWSACTNPVVTNTPDIGNETVAQTLGAIPAPTDGVTFLALGEGEQVSQAFCSPLPEDAPVSLELDLARLNIGAGLVPETEQVFLEIWGGLSVDCSRRELLWASPALDAGWKRYCITLRPRAFLTQLTLRANTDLTQPTPGYLLVDNLKPVDRCP